MMKRGEVQRRLKESGIPQRYQDAVMRQFDDDLRDELNRCEEALRMGGATEVKGGSVRESRSSARPTL